MATIQRNLACEEYAKGYIELTDTRKNTFSRLCNKLLNDNFIYAYKQDDRNDYYEILHQFHKKISQKQGVITNNDLPNIDEIQKIYNEI